MMGTITRQGTKMKEEPDMGMMLITGASRGIGAATARLAGASGYSVAVNYINDAGAAEKVVTDIRRGGGTAGAIRADVAEEAGVLELFSRAEAELGPLSVLVNNAAVTGGFARVDQISQAMVTQIFATNVIGAMICAREAVLRLSTRYGGPGGSIINISSQAAVIGSAGEWVHYAATKGAINTFTTGLAREVAAEGIRVNAVSPGLIDTDMHAAAGAPDRAMRLAPGIPMGRPGTPEEVARTVLWLASASASYITAAIVAASGGR
jgi:NAD(P)-dependent dehydrogenase (short-subunit alcohol dehydrogenase family)